MKLNPDAFRRTLAERLFERATRYAEGSHQQDAALLGASLLERGEPCPRWIAADFGAVATQDAYGMAYIDHPEEVRAIWQRWVLP